jgi:hypothetical protein
MKKVTLTVPWGQYDLIVKKNLNKNSVYYNVFFLQIIFHNTGLYWNIDRQTDRQTRLCLRKYRIYTEADREIYRKCITKRKKYTRIKKHFWLIAAMQIGLPVPSFAQMLAVLSLELFLQTIIYITWKVLLWGSICLQAEININKK